MKGMNEEEYAEWQKQWQGSDCPLCGRYTKYVDCPDEAPDFFLENALRQVSQMIDFSEYGSIVVHPKASELGLTIQFFPDTRSKLGSMLRLLDEYLQPRNIERSILLQSTKRFPIPCVILHGVFEQ